MEATIRVTEDERRAGALAPSRAEGALRALHRQGYVVLEGCLALDYVDALADDFRELMSSKVARSNIRAIRKDARQSVNDGVLIDFRPQGGNHDLNRWNMHLPSRAPFLDDRLLADPIATALIESLLGEDCILPIIASDTPYPGSGFQTVHQDDVLPRLTMNVPLVDVGDDDAPIEVWPGTHLGPDGPGPGRPGDAPVRWTAEQIRLHLRHARPARVLLPRGSILLRDHRLLHRGTANVGASPRPMLSLLFFPRPPEVPERAVLDEIARMAFEQRERARLAEPYDFAALDRANALGRHVEYLGGSDRDYRRAIPDQVFAALGPRARRRLRLASVGGHDAPCDDIPRTDTAGRRLLAIVERHRAHAKPAGGAGLDGARAHG